MRRVELSDKGMLPHKNSAIFLMIGLFAQGLRANGSSVLIFSVREQA